MDRSPWATLLLQGFAMDVLGCPYRQGWMQRIAWIPHPEVVRAFPIGIEAKPQPP